jgi:hypothetical protein
MRFDVGATAPTTAESRGPPRGRSALLPARRRDKVTWWRTADPGSADSLPRWRHDRVAGVLILLWPAVSGYVSP